MFSEEDTKNLLKNSLNIGDVFLGNFEEAKHKKFFVVAGMSDKKVKICSVFINQCRLVSVWFVGTRTTAARHAACLTQHSYFLSKQH